MKKIIIKKENNVIRYVCPHCMNNVAVFNEDEHEPNVPEKCPKCGEEIYVKNE